VNKYATLNVPIYEALQCAWLISDLPCESSSADHITCIRLTKGYESDLLIEYLHQISIEFHNIWHTCRQEAWVSSCKISEILNHRLWRNKQRKSKMANIATVLLVTVCMVNQTFRHHCVQICVSLEGLPNISGKPMITAQTGRV
jgi:hypothetical protein